MKNHSAIEPLEARIAPASLVGNVLTYTDIDGDLVKVTFTGGAKVLPGDINFFSGSVSPGGSITTPQALKNIDLGGYIGGGFTLVAKTQVIGGVRQGDSHANIAAILALDTNLGTIKVDGDVGNINTGATIGTPGAGLKSFTALSIGRNNSKSENSTLYNVGTFTVKGDFVDQSFTFRGGAKSITIGGNLAETMSDVSAVINSDGNIGSVKIGGSIIGLSGGVANLLLLGDTLGSVSIGGSIIGGSTDIGSIAQVTIFSKITSFSLGGDLQGGRGEYGGALFVGAVGSLKIGGSIRGTDNVSKSGELEFFGSAKSVTIGGSIQGGDFTSGEHTRNGVVVFDRSVDSFKLGHDLIAGHLSGGTLTSSSMISVSETIGSLTIGGSLIGDPTLPATLSFGGGDNTPLALTAIKTLAIKGGVDHARIIAGFSQASTFKNMNAGFGSITIGGSLTASHIYAGSGKGTDGIPGTSDDTLIPDSEATIGSIKIGGIFAGITGSDTPYYIYAPTINKLTVGSASYNRAELQGIVHFDTVGKATAISVIQST